MTRLVVSLCLHLACLASIVAYLVLAVVIIDGAWKTGDPPPWTTWYAACFFVAAMLLRELSVRWDKQL